MLLSFSKKISKPKTQPVALDWSSRSVWSWARSAEGVVLGGEVGAGIPTPSPPPDGGLSRALPLAPQEPVTVLGERREGRKSRARPQSARAAPPAEARELPRRAQKEGLDGSGGGGGGGWQEAGGAGRGAGGETRGEAPGAKARSPRRRPSRVRARPHQLSARRASRGARVEGHGALTMELSEYVQKGFQMLADPGSFDSNAFTLLLRAAFQSLLDAQADEAVLGKPLGSALDRPGWRGARRRGARPSEKGKAPGRGSLRASPFAPDGVWGCGSARTHGGPRALFCPQLAPAHSQLHVPGLISLRRLFVPL